jgi:hypothetical protein
VAAAADDSRPVQEGAYTGSVPLSRVPITSQLVRIVGIVREISTRISPMLLALRCRPSPTRPLLARRGPLCGPRGVDELLDLLDRTIRRAQWSSSAQWAVHRVAHHVPWRRLFASHPACTPTALRGVVTRGPCRVSRQPPPRASRAPHAARHDAEAANHHAGAGGLSCLMAGFRSSPLGKWSWKGRGVIPRDGPLGGQEMHPVVHRRLEADRRWDDVRGSWSSSRIARKPTSFWR